MSKSMNRSESKLSVKSKAQPQVDEEVDKENQFVRRLNKVHYEEEFLVKSYANRAKTPLFPPTDREKAIQCFHTDSEDKDNIIFSYLNIYHEYVNRDSSFFTKNLYKLNDHFHKIMRMENPYNDGYEDQVVDTKVRVVSDNNFYSHKLFCVIYHYKHYQHEEVTVFEALIRVLKLFLRYIFIRIKTNTGDPTLARFKGDYSICLLYYQNIVKFNPILYFRLADDQSLLEMLHAEYPEYDAAISEYYARYYEKEDKLVADRDMYSKVIKIEDKQMNLSAYKSTFFEEFGLYTQNLNYFLQDIKNNDSRVNLNDFINLYDLTFKEILYQLSSRVQTEGFYEDESSYMKSSNSVDQIQRLNTRFKSVIVVDSYLKMYKVYENLLKILSAYTDIAGNPIKIEGLINTYRPEYKDFKQKFIKIIFTKKVMDYRSSFEIKIFEKYHWEYYETFNKVHLFEKFRIEKQEHYLKLMTTCEEIYADKLLKNEKIIYSEIDKTSLEEEIKNLSKENIDLKRESKVKDMLIRNLESMDITTYNYYISDRMFNSRLVFLIVCVFIAVVVLEGLPFLIQVGIASGKYIEVSDSLVAFHSRAKKMDADNTDYLLQDSVYVLAQVNSRDNQMASYIDQITQSDTLYPSQLDSAADYNSDFSSIVDSLIDSADTKFVTTIDGLNSAFQIQTDILTEQVKDQIDSIKYEVNTLVERRNNTMIATVLLNTDTIMLNSDDKTAGIQVRNDTLYENVYTDVMDSMVAKSVDILDYAENGLKNSLIAAGSDNVDQTIAAETDLLAMMDVVHTVSTDIQDQFTKTDGLFDNIDAFKTSMQDKILDRLDELKDIITVADTGYESMFKTIVDLTTDDQTDIQTDQAAAITDYVTDTVATLDTQTQDMITDLKARNLHYHDSLDTTMDTEFDSILVKYDSMIADTADVNTAITDAKTTWTAFNTMIKTETGDLYTDVTAASADEFTDVNTKVTAVSTDIKSAITTVKTDLSTDINGITDNYTDILNLITNDTDGVKKGLDVVYYGLYEV